MIGQINRGTKTGEFIYELCLQSNINSIVEIGTWNGMGSTKCIADAIMSRFDDSYLISIESNKEMFNIAKREWDARLSAYMHHMQEKIKLIHGRIIEKEDLISLDEIRAYENYISAWESWYKQDLEALETCENILQSVPNKIDLLLLDGGEFSTLAEFNILGPRAKYILLDDTNTTKCNKISKFLLVDESFDLIFNEQNDGRNGFMAFRRL